ncbi:MAG: TRAP transporter small permease subunit [Alphaproteobacteria bacterium]|nr:TRAP transporter small permease subunit [Alphaproteobacteria bacterium]
MPSDRPIESIVRKSVRHLAILAGVTLLFLMLLTVYAVVMRYIFNAPILWALDVGRMGLVVLVFFGLGYCGLTGGHIAVDFISVLAPPKLVRVSDVIIRSGCFVLIALMAWQGFKQGLDAIEMGEGTNELEIPLFPFFGVVALGSAIYCIVLLLQVSRAARREPMDDPGES